MRTARASRGRSPEDGASGTGIPAALPRRLVLPACGAALFLVPGAGSTAAPSEAAGWEALRAGAAVVLFRHATAPGTGDPAGMRLGDCSTQRNLDAAGGAHRRGVPRPRRRRRHGPDLAVVPGRRDGGSGLPGPRPGRAGPRLLRRTRRRAGADGGGEARPARLGRAGPGALVVVTHQVNVTALAGVEPSSGEGVVLRRDGGDLVVAGRVRP